ncbi:MAG: TonB-dependent receptor [Pseudomonadota bacterium]
MRPQCLPRLLKIIAILAVGLTIAPTVSAQQQDQVPTSSSLSIDIAEPSLGDALIALSEAFGTAIFADEALVTGRQAAPVRGRFTLEAALEQMLAGTGLAAKQTDRGAYVIGEKPQDSAATAVPPASSEPRTPTRVSSTRIDELVVRGEKFDRSLQDTVASVSVLRGDVIDSSFITDIEQVLQRIPNVVDSGGSGYSIRGIPERGVGSGTGDTSQTSAIYVDGAVQSQFGAGNGLLSTWDVEQVEVFRGAQTTTQGRAALGGAIIINTANPTFDWTGRARVAVGEFDSSQYAVAFGGPIVDDVLAFRVAADFTATDGFTEFVTADGQVLDDVGINERDQIRAKLLYSPTKNLSAILSITQSDSIEGLNAVNGPDFFAGRITDTVNITSTEVTSYSLNVEYEISDALSVTSITTYSDLTNKLDPVPATEGVGITSIADASDKALTQELRLNYDAAGVFRGIAGFYYNEFDETSARILSGPFLGAIFSGSDGYDNNFQNIAVFGEAEFELTDAWTVVFGARYDFEDSTRNENQSFQAVPELPFLPNTNVDFEGDADFDAFLPKLALTYNFTENVGLSLVYQRGYRPGGADIRPDSNEPIEFAPEFTDNYELAFRGLFLDGSLSVSANAFLIDYKDMQVRFSPDPLVPLVRFIANAGESELYGFELETLWEASDDLSLYASAGIAKSEFGDFLFQGGNFNGNEFPFQPRFNASFGGTYVFGSGFSLTVDNIYSESYFAGIQNGPELENDPYFVTNVRFGYTQERWGAFVYGQNVFDEQYLVSVGRNTTDSSLSGATLGQPQTFGVIFEVSF